MTITLGNITRLTAAATWWVVFSITFTVDSFTQEGDLRGRVIDKASRTALGAANVSVVAVIDTTKGLFTSSRQDGTFHFENLAEGRYTLRISYLGYRPLRVPIVIQHLTLDVEDLEMEEATVELAEVVVYGKQPPIVQLGDTTEFNARLFKTNPDASAEDLLTKLPTVVIENGIVKAQGEQVQRVLVDGREFFGNDPMLTLRNLPADIVDRVQVFDKMSDQAEFTGFDDGQSVKTLNVITRPERRLGAFGKLFGGHGDQGRYSVGGNANSFQGDRRLTFLGSSNNINRQNFTTQDLFGVVSSSFERPGMFAGRASNGGVARPLRSGGMVSAGGSPFTGEFRGGTADFLVGEQQGITKAHALGANYADLLAGGWDMYSSYFYNSTTSRNDQSIERENFVSSDSSIVYSESNDSDNRNYNHRFDSRIEYSLSSETSVIARPRLSVQNHVSASSFAGVTSSEVFTLNESSTSSTNDIFGYDGSASVVVQHRFPTAGQTLSADIFLRSNRQKNTGTQGSLTMSSGSGESDTLEQTTTGNTSGYTVSSRFAYTLPVGRYGLIQMRYNPAYTTNRTESWVYDEEVGSVDGLLDSLLSGSYESYRSTQNVGADVQYHIGKASFFGGLSYEVTNLEGIITFPIKSAVERAFYRILPNAGFTFSPARGSSLRIRYRSSTTIPAIGQLQITLDNSNPLQLRTGNRDLKQATVHSLVARYMNTDAEDGSSNLLFLSALFTEDIVGNATIFGTSGGTEFRGLTLSEGVQLTYPVNLDHSWSANGLFAHTVYWDWLSSNFSLTTGVRYSWTPGLVNQVLNVSKSTTLNQGVTVASNVSPDLDFTLSYSANYNIVRYSLRADLNDWYFNHVGRLKCNLILAGGYVIRTEITHSLYSGEQSGLRQSFVLWNVAAGRKIFAGNKGEIRLAVTDVFNKNRGITRTVTESSLENTTNLVLGRYVLLTFTYTLG